MLHSYVGGLSILHWINDGLMAIFFLFVGLEIKRELVDGRLATWDQRRLPVLAAVAGMAAPALVYLAVIGGDPARVQGWAIPRWEERGEGERGVRAGKFRGVA